MLIPEVILYKHLSWTFQALWNDLQLNIQAGTEQSSRLWSILGVDEGGVKIEIEGFDYYEQSKILLTPNSNRELKIFIGYNLERADFPTIHILLPSEESTNIGIAADEGYRREESNNDGFVIETPSGEVNAFQTENSGHWQIDNNSNQSWLVSDDNPAAKYVPTYTQQNRTTFRLLVTSVSYNEVIIINNFLKYCLLGLVNSLSLRGFENPMISASDLQVMNNVVPTHIYQRMINYSFTYQFHARDFFDLDISPVNPIQFNTNPTINE